MPPPNTTFATATQLPAFPCDVSQSDINDAGVNYTVYYKFTSSHSSRVIGAWGFSGNIGSGYRPVIRAYHGPVGAPVQILAIATTNMPIQFPVLPDTEYFLEFTKNLDNAGPNSLRVRCEDCPLGNPSGGDIIVNDDTTGFPMWIGTPTVDNETRTFIKDMPAGEAGDIIPTGVLCLEESNVSSIKLFSTTAFTQISNTGPLNETIRIKSNADRNLFYIGTYTGGVAKFRTLTPAGVLSGTTTLTAMVNMDGLCADVGNSILYVAQFGAAGAVKRWNISGGAFLSDLAAGIANYQIPDIIILAGDIFVLYHNLVTQDVNVKRYNAAGAVVTTYNLGVQTGLTKPRMTWAADTPNSFWVMTHNTGGQSIFTNIKVSDASVITTRLQREYEGGAYEGAETATPDARFGSSTSCPFMILSIPSPPGMFKPVTNKRTDSDGVQTVAIPNPTFKTALMP